MLTEMTSPDGKKLGISVVATAIAAVIVFKFLVFVIPGEYGLLFGIIFSVYALAAVPWLVVRLLADRPRESAVKPHPTQAGP
jgi:hypothetical protein